MKIVMPCDGLSNNGLLRVYPFAKFLSNDFDITVTGPIEKQGIFNPLKEDKTIKYLPVKQRRVFPFYLRTFYDVYKNLDADIVHCFKPTPYGFIPSLRWKKKNKSRKLVLDIDDWESQYMLDNYFSLKPWSLAKFMFVDAYMPESYFIKKALERQMKKADAIVTSSRTLQRLFGGTWIPTGPDTTFFDPEKASGKYVRKEFDLIGKTIVLFTGTPKKHKGVEELITAVKEAREDCEDIHLLIVGADKNNPYVRTLEETEGVTLIGYRNHREMPNFLAAADIVCIPQKNTLSANAQLPIKIFEPMAMEKAVITTNTSDMKEIFQNCGTVVQPDSTEALKKAILKYVDDKMLRQKHGVAARKECIKKYSWRIMKKKTFEVYESI